MVYEIVESDEKTITEEEVKKEIQTDLSNLTAQFNLYDFYEAMGINQSGQYDENIIKGLKECLGKNIIFQTVRIVNGKKIYDFFNFFSHTQFDEETKNILMIFNKSLADYLIGFKKMFSKIQLQNIGKLSSKYSIRIYEMAMSYMGFEGKQGNKKGSWYFEISIDDFRNALSIQPNEYKRIFDFTKNIIDIPLKEINSADIGIAITAKSVKEGRKVTKERFDCTTTSKKRLFLRKNKTKLFQKTQFLMLKKIYGNLKGEN